MKKDKYGFRYVESLPNKAKKVTNIWQLVKIGPNFIFFYKVKNIDIYIYSNKLKRYEYYYLHKECSGNQIEKLIKQGKIFFVDS